MARGRIGCSSYEVKRLKISFKRIGKTTGCTITKSRRRTNLGEEPTGTNNNDLITIALRFQQSGISSKNTEASCTRRFSKEDTMNNVLNWVDAVHGLERERVCLSTMNGAKSFVYRDEEDGEEGGSMTLEEAGLGKMTALRVGEIVLEDVDGGGGGSVETDDADSAEVDDNDE